MINKLLISLFAFNLFAIIPQPCEAGINGVHQVPLPLGLETLQANIDLFSKHFDVLTSDVEEISQTSLLSMRNAYAVIQSECTRLQTNWVDLKRRNELTTQEFEHYQLKYRDTIYALRSHIFEKTMAILDNLNKRISDKMKKIGGNIYTNNIDAFQLQMLIYLQKSFTSIGTEYTKALDAIISSSFNK